MEFGRVPDEQIGSVDFSLPTNPQFTIDTLTAADKSKPVQVHVGCAKWGRKNGWARSIRPKLKTPTFWMNT